MAGSQRAARKPLPHGVAGHDMEVLEKNTDTSWALFQSLHEQHQLGFEKTRPAPVLDAAPAAAARAPLTVDDVMLEARRNNRVCPTPVIWQRLYEFLPNKVAQLPQVPGTRAAWDQLPPLHKRSLLRLHIEWAASQGVLQQVYEALRALPENRWHHMGD